MTRRKTPQIIGETEIANRLGKFGEIRHPHNELKMIHRVIDGARAEVIQRRAEMAEKRERYPTGEVSPGVASSICTPRSPICQAAGPRRWLRTNPPPSRA